MLVVLHVLLGYVRGSESRPSAPMKRALCHGGHGSCARLMYGEALGLLTDFGVLEHDAMEVKEMPAYDPNCLEAIDAKDHLAIIVGRLDGDGALSRGDYHAV